MKCSKCGTENLNGNKFCTGCGNDLSSQQTNENQFQPTNTQQQENQIYQQPIEQQYNNQIQPRKVGIAGAIVILVLCILSANIIGIILSIIALVNLSKANELPEGMEKESKIKTGKTCRTIALVVYIVSIVISIILLIISIGTVFSIFGDIKESVENGKITITDGEGNIIKIENNEDNDYSSTTDEEEKIVCIISSDTTTSEYTYTGIVTNGKIGKIITEMKIEMRDTDDVEKTIDAYCDDDCESKMVGNHLYLTSEEIAAEGEEITIEYFKTYAGYMGATCE